MSNQSRIILAVASLGLIATYFLPVWFIFLTAPQYPEGLTMNIWLTRLTGQVDIINGLNHYIGMKHIKTEMFPEFDFFIYIVGFYILFGLFVAITGRRKLLFTYLLLSVIGGIAAMYDFYRWGYDYGHNLDPTAAIQIPGFSYQPPLIGHKTLLNFDAYSYPDTGGWVIVGVTAIFFIVWILEFRRSRKQKKHMNSIDKKIFSPIAALAVFSLLSCSAKPEPFNYGKDVCDNCKMAIVDPKFGAQIVTHKGKIFRFDDAQCIKQYIKSAKIKDEDINQIVFSDYENNKNFISNSTLFFVMSPQLKSPMGSNAAAFSDNEAASAAAAKVSGKVMTWNEFFQMNK